MSGTPWHSLCVSIRHSLIRVCPTCSSFHTITCTQRAQEDVSLSYCPVTWVADLNPLCDSFFGQHWLSAAVLWFVLWQAQMFEPFGANIWWERHHDVLFFLQDGKNKLFVVNVVLICFCSSHGCCWFAELSFTAIAPTVEEQNLSLMLG